MIAYQGDDSAICVSDADPRVTARYPGPRNSTAQLAAIALFHATNPPAPESGSATLGVTISL